MHQPLPLALNIVGVALYFRCVGNKNKSLGAKSGRCNGWPINSMFWVLKNVFICTDLGELALLLWKILHFCWSVFLILHRRQTNGTTSRPANHNYQKWTRIHRHIVVGLIRVENNTKIKSSQETIHDLVLLAEMNYPSTSKQHLQLQMMNHNDLRLKTSSLRCQYKMYNNINNFSKLM